jgi:hypothetical protein
MLLVALYEHPWKGIVLHHYNLVLRARSGEAAYTKRIYRTGRHRGRLYAIIDIVGRINGLRRAGLCPGLACNSMQSKV